MVRRAIVVTAVIFTALSVFGVLPAQAQTVAPRSKPLSVPVFINRSAVRRRADVPISFTVRVRGNPTPSIQATRAVPKGLSLQDNGNGTATISGSFAFAGTYTVFLRATNSQGSVTQDLTFSVRGLPGVRHVFVIMLENAGYNSTFGSPANDPYLATTLPSQGALLKNYYGTGHYSNDNYIGFISGQPPNVDNQFDCVGGFVGFPAGAGQSSAGIQQGTGCVYPPAVQTLAGQLTAKGYKWKGYMQDMGNVPTREATTCAHPPIGSPDPSFIAVPGDGYATRHDPFVYFQSIIDQPALCSRRVVPLGSVTGAMPANTPPGVTGLAADLRSIATTPNFSFITPNLCYDGHDYPCINQPSGPSRLADIDSFLRTWVPLIESSPAFKKNGLLEITFDEGNISPIDARACCGETPGPATLSGGNGIAGPGGGHIGAVLISPFITPGTVVTKKLNHYSSLASIEDLFGLPRLAEAKTVTSTFDKGVFKR